jgi:hypothetical protein
VEDGLRSRCSGRDPQVRRPFRDGGAHQRKFKEMEFEFIYLFFIFIFLNF